MSDDRTHVELAEALRRRVIVSGVIDPELRVQLLAGGDLAGAPFRELARHVDESSSRVTDEQVAAARDALGSDRAAFEVIMTVSVGAGFRRWDAASRAIARATDAAA